MTTVDKFIEDFLQHEYDPVKAREYYLRTRKLKGRKPAKARPPLNEDEIPPNTPSGAKLVDFKNGVATYSDGTQVDNTGWVKPKSKAEAQAKVDAAQAQNNSNRAKNGLEPRSSIKVKGRRIGTAEQRLIRARTLASKIKDPAKRRAMIQKISATQAKLDRQKV